VCNFLGGSHVLGLMGMEDYIKMDQRKTSFDDLSGVIVMWSGRLCYSSWTFVSCYQKLSAICPSSDLWLGSSLEIKVKVAEMVCYLVKWNWIEFVYLVSGCYKFFLEFSSWTVLNVVMSSSSSSSSSSYHRVGLLVELFQSHTSRSLFSGLSCFLLPFGLQFFIIVSNI
jgi:hypothetical protein